MIGMDGWMLRSRGIRDVFKFCWAISGRFLRSPFGQAWDNLAASLGHLGAISEPSWGHIGASQGHLCLIFEPSKSHLWIFGPSWGFWGHVVASWGGLGAILRPGWAVLGALGASGDHLRAILRQLQDLWKQSWGLLVASWGHPGALLGHLGRS